jgi:hypothetical protein
MGYYENEKKEAAEALTLLADIGGDTQVFLLGGIMNALYDIADELHELNQVVRSK